jgi:hypothetical protein
LEIFDKNSADKIQSKNYKEVNPPCLMPIRVKLFLKIFAFKVLKKAALSTPLHRNLLRGIDNCLVATRDEWIPLFFNIRIPNTWIPWIVEYYGYLDSWIPWILLFWILGYYGYQFFTLSR